MKRTEICEEQVALVFERYREPNQNGEPMLIQVTARELLAIRACQARGMERLNAFDIAATAIERAQRHNRPRAVAFWRELYDVIYYLEIAAPRLSRISVVGPANATCRVHG